MGGRSIYGTGYRERQRARKNPLKKPGWTAQSKSRAEANVGIGENSPVARITSFRRTPIRETFSFRGQEGMAMEILRLEPGMADSV